MEYLGSRPGKSEINSIIFDDKTRNGKNSVIYIFSLPGTDGYYRFSDSYGKG